MKKFEFNKDYDYSVIKNTAGESINLTEYGGEMIGEFFVVLSDDNGNVVSFILTGCNTEYIMTCIYTDFN